MKILLDENIDVRLKNFFPVEYTVYTVRDMGWNGIKNGELLLLLKENNFDAWIVVDKNIPSTKHSKSFLFCNCIRCV
jgi:predicted nuclease of predicted toxin-antitoxin system